MRPGNDLNRYKLSAALTALAIAIVGCAGSGDTTGATGGIGATGGGLFADVATVNLPDTPGYAQISLLTGAGRGPANSAVIRRVSFTDRFAVEETRLQSEVLLVLNRYNSQILPLNVPNVAGQPSRQFESLDFDFLGYTDTSGAEFSSVVGLPLSLQSDIRLFPGRQAHIPIFFDQDVVTVGLDANNQQVATFDEDHFNTINFGFGEPTLVRSILSDYVSFDISGMAPTDRPLMSDGSRATRLFFSGDAYALASQDPYQGSAIDFEQVVPQGQTDVLVGRLSGPATIPGGAGASTTPGTYSLVQADPTDINNAIPNRITGLQGIWKEHFRQVRTSTGIQNLGFFSNVHGFEGFALPASEDGPRQDVVLVSQTLTTNPDGTVRATINNLFWGYVDLDAKTLQIYPAANLPLIDTLANLTGERTGTVTAQYSANRAITTSSAQTRFISYTLSNPPAGFPASGTLVVLRR